MELPPPMWMTYTGILALFVFLLLKAVTLVSIAVSQTFHRTPSAANHREPP
ncbi:hypothetical protein HPP92_015573 [Vanilla planifolia]|uniref:Uncharacterized protein n=1 Tax=Vanilla planifolia TaxID=51239 RepID=A0A835QH50_VANPL|nr:hypothetical protein HPP92_016214 [Vanilla planifolia]KAG0471027.1 hypothetical protein HPP92_015573 [Vanilla planifolia]